MKPGGKLLVSEPKLHVPDADFEAGLATARQAGFELAECPSIRWEQSAVLVKPGA